MPIPSKKSECALGCLRRINAQGKTVLLINNQNGWIDDSYTEMAKTKGIIGNYFIFSFPEVFETVNVEDTVGNTYKFQKAAGIQAFGFNDFEKAEDKYISLSNTECQRTMVKWDVTKHFVDNNSDSYN